jgi:HAD superfamily hydrolase (TIGR01484 family)
MKKLIVFDLDGTLAESKSSIDLEMAGLLDSLLDVVQVAVISGAAWPQFQRQVLAALAGGDRLKNLSLLPTCGTQFYRYACSWELVYCEKLSDTQRRKIIESLQAVSASAECKPETVWGEVIEDRGSQITFSALGQQAPLAAKKQWDPQFIRRRKLQAALNLLLPEFSVRIGGATSIDVTRRGIDKAYGIRKLREILHREIEEMIYVGDAIFPGGNDYPAKEAGVLPIEVRDPHETKRVIEALVACLGGAR